MTTKRFLFNKVNNKYLKQLQAKEAACRQPKNQFMIELRTLSVNAILLLEFLVGGSFTNTSRQS